VNIDRRRPEKVDLIEGRHCNLLVNLAPYGIAKTSNALLVFAVQVTCRWALRVEKKDPFGLNFRLGSRLPD
jgi:hypothetical protein